MTKYAQLGDICLIKSAKRIFESEYVEEGIPFIRGQEISDGSVGKTDTQYECKISVERYNELKQTYGVPRYGDILITAVGTIGNLYFVNTDTPFYYKDGNIIQFTDFSSCVYSKYLFYVMKSPFFKKQIEYSLIGAVQKALTMVMLSEIKIPLPPLDEQIKTATVLSTIDDKISTNAAVVTELEAMAKALYDYWFVQFDFPDESGKPYRTSGGEMVWNDQLKREIPKGWSVKSLSHGIKSINTGLNPRNNFSLGKGNIRYITVKNLTTSGTIDFSGCDTLDEKAREMVHARSDIKVGDILFASIAPLGRCYLIQSKPENWDINESVFSIRTNSETLSPEFLYMYLMGDIFIKGATSNSTGSIFKGIRINTLMDMIAIFPPKPVVDKFSVEIKKMLELKEQNNEEIRELTKLRDWLLPMLMNGQARVE